jgi:hypothetical protein
VKALKANNNDYVEAIMQISSSMHDDIDGAGNAATDASIILGTLPRAVQVGSANGLRWASSVL